MYQGRHRAPFIDAGLVTALGIAKGDPGVLRGSQPLQLRLVQGGNPLFVGSIERGIGPLVILKRTDVHGGLGHGIAAILAGLGDRRCQQQQGIKVFQWGILITRSSTPCTTRQCECAITVIGHPDSDFVVVVAHK